MSAPVSSHGVFSLDAFRFAERVPLVPSTHPVPRRIPNEFYPTPPAAVRALLSVEAFDGSIWEPACGEGAIAKVLVEAGHDVIATDLVDYGYGIGGRDFLLATRSPAKHIVTNPPYGFGLADRFIAQALRFCAETGGNVAMLLNLASLCHRSRTAWWQANPPARLYAIDDVVCWPEHRYGKPPMHFVKHRYVWAVWTPGHTGPSAFWWLSAAAFRETPISSDHSQPRSSLCHPTPIFRPSPSASTPSSSTFNIGWLTQVRA